MPTINNQEINSSSRQEKFNGEEADVEFSQLPRENSRQVPGYLPVIVKNCPLSDREVKFFGVTQKGAEISGMGVTATTVEQEEGAKVVYFDMAQLVEAGQYTENTVEGVITVGRQEVGRELVNTEAAIYLG